VAATSSRVPEAPSHGRRRVRKGDRECARSIDAVEVVMPAGGHWRGAWTSATFPRPMKQRVGVGIVVVVSGRCWGASRR
jgi:hypothetical protein